MMDYPALIIMVSALCFAWWVLWKHIGRGRCLEGKHHDWTGWQSRQMTYTAVGLLYPKEVRGVPIKTTVQVRRCKRCELEQTLEDK